MLPEVVNKANYVGSGEYSIKGEKNKPVSRYDYFETPATIGGIPYVVKFDVEVLPDINNYRTHQIENVDLTTPGGSLVGQEPTAAPDGTSPRDVAKDIVQEKDGGVKKENDDGTKNLDLPTAEEWREREATATQPAEAQTDPGRLPTAEEWKNRGTEPQPVEMETEEPAATPGEPAAPGGPATPEEMSDGGRSVNGYAASPGLRKLGVKIAEPITDTIGADVLVSQAQKAKAAERALNKARATPRPSEKTAPSSPEESASASQSPARC